MVAHAPHAKLNVLGLGIALGLVWAISMLFVGMTSWLYSWGNSFVDVMGSIYVGYKPTLVGSLYGTIFGFIDGFIGGVLIAWFYNLVCSVKR